ncbi:MAG: UDP-N-acetylmuramoyl-L-alanine--D-glutamate ligase [Acidithiobacillus sp.]|nr:UDP-N-acetylmuramoyl-L-alanine--D-glutamate ligase [Acidithiobacillus sp.]
MNLSWVGRKVAVLGTGKTGASLLDAVLASGAEISVWDTRADLDLPSWQRRYPGVRFHFGPMEPAALLTQDLVLCSPGISPLTPAIARARHAGIPVWGDVELFAQHAQAPIIAITGSNGKSTVTTLVGKIMQAAGRRVAVGGNLGTPALELLPKAGEAEAELYVLELSSFQLEYSQSLRPKAAVILNITPDHLDWHGDFAAYVAAKWRIAQRMGLGDFLLLHADDPVLREVPALCPDLAVEFFGQGQATELRQGILMVAGEPLLPAAQLSMAGRHNQENALAAARLARQLGAPDAAIIQTLREFVGLPHRLQWVAKVHGVDYYDDSKATNVGASLRAIASLPAPLVLILGGDAKGADLQPLQAVCAGQRAAVLLGKDEERLAEILDGILPLHRTGRQGMTEVVRQAANLAQPGDRVLLSPACASLDMFVDYQDRGRQFAAAVARLAEGSL